MTKHAIQRFAATVGRMVEHGEPLNGAGSPNVLIGNKPAWRGHIDEHRCTHHGIETVIDPSDSVLVNGQGATRTGHFVIPKGGGPPHKIQDGDFNVLVGEAGVGALNKENMDALLAALCKLKEDWSSLQPEERLARVQQLINDHADRTGMPRPLVRMLRPNEFNGKAKQWAGIWDGSKWEIAIAEKNFQSSTWPTEVFGGVVGHEVRHSEQNWYAIRKRASDICTQNGGCRTPQQRETSANLLVKSTGVDREAAKAAVKQPLTRGSKEWRYGSVHERQALAHHAWSDINDNIRRDSSSKEAELIAYHHRPGGSDANEVGHQIENRLLECCP